MHTDQPQFDADSNLFGSLSIIGEMLTEGLMGYTLDGELVLINAAARVLLGQAITTDPAACAAWFAEHLATDAGTPVAPAQLPQHRVARGETLTALAMRYISPDGQERIFHIDGRLLPQSAEAPPLVLLVLHDKSVTSPMTWQAQRDTQDRFDALTLKLSRQNAQFDAVVGSIPDGLAIVDSEERVLRVNKAGEEMLGSPPAVQLEANVAHYDIRDLDGIPITPEDLPLARALRGERVIDLEQLLWHAKDQPMRVSTSASPISSQDGAIIGAVAVFRDVTERRREEAALAQRVRELEGLREIAQATAIARQEAAIFGAIVVRLAQLLQTKTCALLTWNGAEGVFQAQPPTYGIGAKHLTTLTVPRDLFDQILSNHSQTQVVVLDQRDCGPDSPEATLLAQAQARNAVLARLEVHDYLIGCILACNTLNDERFTEQEVRLLQTVIPQVALAIENSRFYTQMRKTAASVQVQARNLARANDELDAFTYSVSHDLRAPLRAINGFTQLLERSITDPSERIQHQLTRIRVNVEKMGDLIDALLAFSRAGRQVPEKDVIETTTLVQEALHLHDEALTTYGGRVQVEQLPAIFGDKRLLEMVFSNLISNAIKYRREDVPPQIQITGSTANDTVTVAVDDNGIGFDMRYHDKIFQVFQRLHGDGVYEGTGIGLALVRKVIERHGGRIWAQSEPGVGSTFFMELPAPGVHKEE